MYFMLWKSEKRERRINFDCAACQEFKWHERRACYLPHEPGKEKYDFILPLFEGEGHPPRQTGEIKYREQTEDDFLERLDELSRVFPEVPEFELVQMHFKNPFEMCLTGIADPEIVELIELESACTKYNTLPYAGGLQDQPTVILEAFSAIREAENEYNAKKFAAQADKANRETVKPPGRPH